MEFNRETVAAEVNKQYGGVTITDGPNGPFELRSAMRLGKQTTDMINNLANEMERVSTPRKITVNGEEIDDPEFTPDLTAMIGLAKDALALRSTSPADFREWIEAFPENDQNAVLRVIQKALDKADQGESGA